MPDFVSKRSRKSNEKNRLSEVKDRKSSRMEYSLYDARGRRKYLVATERAAFLKAALQAGGETATLCAVLTFTGARISEVLALTSERIDEANRTINVETLKRRRKGLTRSIPVPSDLLLYLDSVHGYSDAKRDPLRADKRLWSWSRTTAWRRIQKVMQLSAAPNYLAKPKSLRHAFGAEAALQRIPIILIKNWMGHSRLETTEIYVSLTGKEERTLARLTWGDMTGYIRATRSNSKE